MGRPFSLQGPHPDWSQKSLELGGEGPVGSQAGACGAWGEWAGGGELAPPWEEGGPSELISISQGGECMAFGDKRTREVLGVLREVDQES